MKKLFLIASIVVLGTASVAVEPAITPKPMDLKTSSGFFELTSNTAICCDKNSYGEAEMLAGYLYPATDSNGVVLIKAVE